MKNIKNCIRFSFIVILIICLFFSLLSCQGDEDITSVNEDVTVVEESVSDNDPVYGGTLRIAIPTESVSLNPLVANNEDIVNFLGLVYESPLYIDNSGHFIPLLVDSWEVDDTGRIYTFNFRKEIYFHDGHELKSDDVIFTINKIFELNNESAPTDDDESDQGESSDNNTESDNDSEQKNDENVPDINQSRYTKYNSLIENVKRIDDYSISITMKEQGREALYFMCFPVLPYNYSSDNQLNGTGPYVYSDTNEKGGIILKVNENWWKVKPYINTVESVPMDSMDNKLKYIQNDDIDLITTRSIASSKYNSDSISVVDYETYYYDCLIPNLFRESMKDINIRKAISYAVDRRQIISSVMINHAVSAEMPVSPDFYAYNIKYKKYEFDDVTARELIEESGYDSEIMENDDVTDNLKINLIVPNEIGHEYRLEVARIISDNLANVGIICNVEQLSPNDYINRLENNNYDLAYCSYYFGPNPDMTEILGTGKSQNYGNVASPELDTILNNCRMAVSEDDVIKSYDVLQQYLTDKVPQIGLFFRRFSILYNKSINDLNVEHENSLFYNVNNWYISNNG